METIPSRIINIGTDMEATFALKFMTGTVAFTFNRECVAIATDPITVFIYPLHHKMVSEILQNENIVKILIKPVSGYKEKIANYLYLADYITEVLDQQSWTIINRMNAEILEEGNKLEIDRKTKEIKLTDTLDRIAGRVGLLMMKYKIMVDSMVNDGLEKEPVESTFNKNQDCLLKFNTVLSRYGPMKFTDLINKVKERGSLCMNPILALQGLIESGALYHDIETTIVGIPDQQN